MSRFNAECGVREPVSKQSCGLFVGRVSHESDGNKKKRIAFLQKKSCGIMEAFCECKKQK